MHPIHGERDIKDTSHIADVQDLGSIHGWIIKRQANARLECRKNAVASFGNIINNTVLKRRRSSTQEG